MFSFIYISLQVEAIRSLEYYVCYYGWDTPSERQNKCHSHNVYNAFYFILAVIPYWFRFLQVLLQFSCNFPTSHCITISFMKATLWMVVTMIILQCVRRLFEEKDMVHLYNGLRYFLTIVAVVVRTVFELKESLPWKVLAILISAIAAIMNTYWDIVIDWGLMRRKSRNFLLRDKLIVPYRSVYFTAMVICNSSVHLLSVLRQNTSFNSGHKNLTLFGVAGFGCSA